MDRPTHLMPSNPDRKFQSVKDKKIENRTGAATRTINTTKVGVRKRNAVKLSLCFLFIAFSFLPGGAHAAPALIDV